MTDPADLIEKWGLECNFAYRVAKFIDEAEFALGRDVEIISGFRSRKEQEQLSKEGRPTAPFYLSNHTTCPATAIDISMGFARTREMKLILGHQAHLNGLRWGGGSPLDDDGLPSDWNHFDLGPRNS